MGHFVVVRASWVAATAPSAVWFVATLGFTIGSGPRPRQQGQPPRKPTLEGTSLRQGDGTQPPWKRKMAEHPLGLRDLLQNEATNSAARFWRVVPLHSGLAPTATPAPDPSIGTDKRGQKAC